MTNSEYLENVKTEYQLVRILSQKNGCNVFLMRHRELNRHIVLRLYKNVIPLYLFLKQITFENLPTVYDVITTSDGQIIIEEYIDGITVAEVIESGVYTYHGMKTVISEICNALEVIHRNGYVHRDIKPENIMISSNGTVKLIDFNASREFKVNLKNDTEILGTIGYAAPEQLGIAQTDYRADIYALGVLINIMLTGVHPSERLADGKAGRIILKCTSIDPAKRYQSANDVKAAL